jgi:hypothetical protein
MTFLFLQNYESAKRNYGHEEQIATIMKLSKLSWEKRHTFPYPFRLVAPNKNESLCHEFRSDLNMCGE